MLLYDKDFPINFEPISKRTLINLNQFKFNIIEISDFFCYVQSDTLLEISDGIFRNA